MKWYAFLILVYLFTALDVGSPTLLAYGEGSSPSFLLILAAFFVLSASARFLPWALLVMGILADLTAAYPTANSIVWFLGPATLGYLIGGYVGYQARGMLFRNSPIAVATLTFLIGIFVQLTIVALVTMRGLPWSPAQAVDGWHPWAELGRRLGALLYTMIVALPVGWALIRCAPFCGFVVAKRRPSMR